MIALPIILGLVIIGIAIYLTLPSTKYNKASNLVLKQEYNEALKILERIYDKYPLAPIKFAECKYLIGISQKSSSEEHAIEIFQKIIDEKNSLPTNCDRSKYELFESRAYYEIAEYNYKQAIKSKYKKPANLIKELKDNIAYINSAVKRDIEDQFSTLLAKHFSELTTLYYEAGIKEETSNKYEEAKRNYGFALEAVGKSDGKIKQENIIARREIVKAKNHEIIETSSFTDINKSDEELRFDFYYRYALLLLSKKIYDDAEKIITNYLPKNYPQIKYLESFILNERVTSAIKIVDSLNKKLDHIMANDYSESELAELYKELDDIEIRVCKYLPEVKDQIKELKPSLFNRLFAHYSSEKNYTGAVSLILKYPKFYEDYTLLKNLAISCYNLVYSGMLDEKNFKIILSSWLTAAFCDCVFLNSMNATQWDDEYTFTLYDSIGSSFECHPNLPENVNYDSPSSTNISIREAQVDILNKFEKMLHVQITNSEFLIKILDFYDNEKKGIEKIIPIIEETFLFASPFFAKYCKINKYLIEALEREFEYSGDENILYAGLPYVTDNITGVFKEFFNAKTISNKIIESIRAVNILIYSSVIGDYRVIYNFDSITYEFEEKVFHAFNYAIDKYPENENIIKLMEENLNRIKNKENFKHQYANFLQELCETKVFENKSMSHYKGLELIHKAYNIVPDNTKICSFLIILINNNLFEILNDETNYESEIFRIFDTIKNSKSRVYKIHSKMLADRRREILSNMSAENRTAILSGYNLNYHGLKVQRVLTYFELLS